MGRGRLGSVSVDTAHARIAFVDAGQVLGRVGAKVRCRPSARASIAGATSTIRRLETTVNQDLRKGSKRSPGFRVRKPHPYPNRLCIHACIHATAEPAKKAQQPRGFQQTHRFRPEHHLLICSSPANSMKPRFPLGTRFFCAPKSEPAVRP